MATRVGVMKKLWNEKPELVGSSFMAGIGLIMVISGNYLYYRDNKDNRRYREVYTVLRHDDPKAATLRKDYLGDM